MTADEVVPSVLTEESEAEHGASDAELGEGSRRAEPKYDFTSKRHDESFSKLTNDTDKSQCDKMLGIVVGGCSPEMVNTLRLMYGKSGPEAQRCFLSTALVKLGVASTALVPTTNIFHCEAEMPDLLFEHFST